MPGLSHWWLLLILVIVLIIFGPGKLPQIGGAIGGAIREFRKTATEIKDEVTAPAAGRAGQRPGGVDRDSAGTETRRPAQSLTGPAGARTRAVARAVARSAVKAARSQPVAASAERWRPG